MFLEGPCCFVDCKGARGKIGNQLGDCYRSLGESGLDMGTHG